MVCGLDVIMNRYHVLLYVQKHHQPLPFQVREPAEVVSDDVVILAPWTRHYHNAFMIRLLGNRLLGPGRANLHR